jgi:SAM-dependent methyltransferase
MASTAVRSQRYGFLCILSASKDLREIESNNGRLDGRECGRGRNFRYDRDRGPPFFCCPLSSLCGYFGVLVSRYKMQLAHRYSLCSPTDILIDLPQRSGMLHAVTECGMLRRLQDTIVRFAGLGARREQFLIKLLNWHFRAKYRLMWGLLSEVPHFYDQRSHGVCFGFRSVAASSHTLERAAVARDVIADGDKVLDIGCGDGFFTRRFYCDRAWQIDAIDVEQSAIDHAQRFHADPKIIYRKMDAVAEAFPQSQYDVVVWNGALGHFSFDNTSVVMKKISSVLGPHGIFVGSESLGLEGHDHLQFFPDEAAVQRLFRPYFRYVATRVVSYPIGLRREFLRQEVFWRCSNGREPLTRDFWHWAAQ